MVSVLCRLQMLGVYTQRAIAVVLVLGIGLAAVWYTTTSILIALRQDHKISAGAGELNRWMIPGLFAYGILQCLIRFLQSQNIVLPMMVTSAVTGALHVLLCCLLVFKLELGSRGAALPSDASYWINAVLLALYVYFSRACARCFTGFSREAFRDIVGFLRLAIPSALMICLEYWSFELVVLLHDKPRYLLDGLHDIHMTWSCSEHTGVERTGSWQCSTRSSCCNCSSLRRSDDSSNNSFGPTCVGKAVQQRHGRDQICGQNLASAGPLQLLGRIHQELREAVDGKNCGHSLCCVACLRLSQEGHARLESAYSCGTD